MRTLGSIASGALAALAVSASCHSDYVKVDDMALGRVVVYRNGVAYFERRARLEGNQLSLSVPREKVDDFLKSLTVRDADSGKPMPVSFPSPGSERGGMIDMTIELPRARSTDVILTYLTEAPAWKPSYRVVVGQDGEVHLQGWAIVDNTSGEDWKDVLVGVGSSSALSFRYDLWSIRSVQRQTLANDDRFAIAPPGGSSPHSESTEGVLLGELGDDDIPRPADYPEAEAVSLQNVPGVSVTSATEPESLAVSGEAIGGSLARPPVEANAKRLASADDRGARKPSREEIEQARRVEEQRQRDIARQEQSRKNVDQLATKLRDGNQSVVIEGYASTGEPDADARALDRANVLRNQLIDKGVAPAKLKVKAMGAREGRPAGVRLVLEGQGGDGKQVPEDSSPVDESHFDSEVPMSIHRGESVMVSIVDAKTEGEVVYLYDPDSPRGNERFAFKAIRLDNPSKNALETGPVTVYGEGRFIGEGLTDPIPPSATALIPFALDRQIVVERKRDGSDRISKLVSLSRGVLTAEVQHVRKTRIAITNRMRQPTTVFVRHDVQDGWELVNAPKQRERLGNSHLFAVKVAAKRSAEIAIEEATPLIRTLDLRTPAALDMVRVYSSDASRNSRLAGSMKSLLAAHAEIATQEQAVELVRANLDDYRVRMDELHAQIVTLKAVRSGGSLMKHLRKKLEEVSERVQKGTLDLVDRQEKLMLARIEFQNAVAELTLAEPDARPVADAGIKAGAGGPQ